MLLQADLWGGPNSAINAVPSTETAFSHRSALYTFQFYASSANSAPPYPTDGISFVDGMVDSITTKMPGTNFGMYGCYIECVHFFWGRSKIAYVLCSPQLNATEAHKVYYGNTTTMRLQRIKSQLDAHNTFDFPQAIGQ